MWQWNEQRNLEMNINKNLIDNFKKYAKTSGTLFILFGIAGLAFPVFMSFTTLAFVAYLMLFSGLLAGWFTWASNKKDWAGWLKSFLLVVMALFMILYPMQGIATLGLLFAFYFFTDAFASFGLALSVRPQKQWILWLFNAITSLILGMIFIWGWPFSSLYMIGLLVGISLLFDGIALLSGGILLDHAEEERHETQT